MARETIEIASDGLNVDGDMSDRLGTIDKDGYLMLMGNGGHFFDWIDGAETVGNMVDGDDACVRREKGTIGVEVEYAFIGEGNDTERGTGALTSQLPRNYVGVMLHGGDDDLVAGTEELLAEGSCHEIDALGGTTGENDFMAVAGVDKHLNAATCGLVLLGCLSGEIMGTSVNVAIKLEIVVGKGVNDALWLLCGGGIIEIDERMSVNGLVEDWER